MKKNFLFGLFAIWLAWFWFGGVSMADCDNVSSEDSLVTAFANTECATIKLIGNIQVNNELDVSRVFELDLNGYTISKTTTVSGRWIVNVNDGWELTIIDSSENEQKWGVKILNKSAGTVIVVNAWGKLIINDWEYEWWTVLYVKWTEASATILNWKFTGTRAWNSAAIHALKGWNILINNWIFYAEPNANWKPQKVIYAGDDNNKCWADDQNFDMLWWTITIIGWIFNWRLSRSNWWTYNIKWWTFTVAPDSNAEGAIWVTAGVWCNYTHCDKWTNDPTSCQKIPGMAAMLNAWYYADALETPNTYQIKSWETVKVEFQNETQYWNPKILYIKAWEKIGQNKPTDPAIDGKIFGWFDTENIKYTADTEINADVVLIAKWWHNVTLEGIDWATLPEWVTSPVFVEDNTAFDSTITPTKANSVFLWWYSDDSIKYNNGNITADTTLTAHWATALTASTSSIKAASIPSDEWREKRNLDKFTVSNSYDATSKTLTVTITDNWMEAYVWGNSQTAKKWLGLIADFGAIVNWSDAVEWIEKYTIWSNNEAENNIDRTDANIYWWDANSNTDFIIWITREDKNWKTIRFVNAAAEDDYVNVKFVFKDKQTTPSYSWGGGSSRSSSTSTTKKDDTKKAEETTKDTAKVDEQKVDEQKSDESKADETKTSEEAKAAADAQALKDGYSQEFIDAYNFARENNITTKDTIREADMDAPLTRIAMAKMLSQYAINVLGKTPDTSIVVPTFPDVDAKLDADYNNWVTLAYQLWIMWIGIEKFRPFDLVTRAEFGTALSRMLFGLADWEWDEWYKTHLDKLMEEMIITNDNPNLKELRGYVMIMLMRSAQ